MTIGWIEISIKQYGGNLYNQLARDILSRAHAVELVSCEARLFRMFRPLKLLESLARLAGLQGKKDVWVRDFYSTLTLPVDRTKGKNIVMVHHDDFSGFSQPARFFLSLLQRVVFYRNLRKADAIVTVSEYWRRHFQQKGYPKVFTIYNGFDLAQFQIADEEVAAFKKREGLEGKPIVYLGNCQKAKGVKLAYEALRGIDAYLVTSGKRQVNIPARHMDLSHDDYPLLLKASSVVLAMSLFQEGWCRIAHEAMLLKTPVIGSGRGGMRELLEGGGQVICEDFSQLRREVMALLDHPAAGKQSGERGYIYAVQFSMERFSQAWIDLLSHL